MTTTGAVTGRSYGIAAGGPKLASPEFGAFAEAASLRDASASYQRTHLRTALSEMPYVRATAQKLVASSSAISWA